MRRRARRGRGGQRRAVRRRAARPRGAQGGGAARRHGLHLPPAGPLHRSGGRPSATPPRSSSGARSYLADDAVAGERPRSPGASPGTRGTTTTPTSRPGSRRWRRCSRRTAGGPGCSPTTTPWSTARPRTAPASGGGARTPTCSSPASGAGTCSAAWSPTRPSPPTSSAGRGPVRLVPPLPRRLPDRRDHRARRRRRAPLPVVAAPGRGVVPARAPGRARRPHLRLRRVPGGVPAEPAGARCAAPTGDEAAVGRPRDAPRPRRRRRARAGADRWYIPRRDVRYVRRNALVVLGNVGDGRDPAVARPARRATSAHDDPLLRGHAVWAARRLGREDLLPPIEQETDPTVLAERAAALR